MAHNGRRLLRPHIDAYRAALAECRADLAQMNFRHQCALADLHRELDALRAELEQARAAFDELRSVSLARQRAETEVAELRRMQAIGRARAAERDPATPLH